jgi:FtsZ-binding cell division protein ZapB
MVDPLSVHELDDLRNWALAAREDDPSDEFPQFVLKLLDENEELRTLLHGAKESGALGVTEQLANEVDRLRKEHDAWQDKERQYKDRCRELEDRINVHALVMDKLVKTMAMAREHLVSGRGTKPEALSNIIKVVEQDYDRAKREDLESLPLDGPLGGTVAVDRKVDERR